MGRGACGVVGGIGTADVGAVADGATRCGAVDSIGSNGNGGGAANGVTRCGGASDVSCDGAGGTVSTFDGRRAGCSTG